MPITNGGYNNEIKTENLIFVVAVILFLGMSLHAEEKKPL